MTIRPLVPLFYAMLGTVLWGDFATAADSEAKGRKLAVVVGNNEYRPNQGLNNLHQAVNDARRLSGALRNAGFTVIEMTHETASQPGKAVLAPNADYIRDQLDGVIESPNLGADDTVLISLHGHGVKFDFVETVTKNGKPEKRVTPKFYFCPADSAPAGIKTANELTERNHLIPLDELYSKLEGCKAATKLLIVDACRNDPTQGNFRESLASVSRPKLPPPPGGIAAFFSCKENQRAVEDADLKQGVFTHFLIQGLEGKADLALEGKPADGIVTLSELTTYVANNTHAYVLDKYKGARQSPDIKGEFDTNTPLVQLRREEYVSKSTGMKLVLVPAGSFQMGLSEESAADAFIAELPFHEKEVSWKDEQPQHLVRISQSFYMGQYEVTQDEFEQVMGVNPSAYTKALNLKAPDDTGRFPVERVSWFDAIEFCNKLSLQDGLPLAYRLTKIERKDGSITKAVVSMTGNAGYRLPTEAEWEYAEKHKYDLKNLIIPKIKTNKELAAEMVDTLMINSLPSGKLPDSMLSGLHPKAVGSTNEELSPFYRLKISDLSGNVLEWCQDAYDPKAYESRKAMTIDPLVESGSSRHVLRGGSWVDFLNVPGVLHKKKFLRPTKRSSSEASSPRSDVGFRVVISGAAVRTP